MSEAELVAEILKLIAKAGLLVHHCRDSRHCEGPKGFPDLVIVGPQGVIFREVKSEHGETSADQDRWGYRLAWIAGYVGPLTLFGVWRPEDLGRIPADLQALGGTPQ